MFLKLIYMQNDIEDIDRTKAIGVALMESCELVDSKSSNRSLIIPTKQYAYN